MQDTKLATTFSAILGQIIKKLREESAVDQSALAKYLNVSIMTISRIENGDTVLDVPQMEKVAIFFNISPTKFFAHALEVKNSLISQGCEVFQNKRELNRFSNVAIVSLAAIVGVLAIASLVKR